MVVVARRGGAAAGFVGRREIDFGFHGILRGLEAGGGCFGGEVFAAEGFEGLVENGADVGDGEAGGGGGTFTLETVVINNIEYATVAQVREMGQVAAKQGADGGHSRVMGDFRNKRSTRARLGVR